MGKVTFMFIDTHCHLSSEYYDDIDLVVKENKDSGIGKIVISGCEIDSIQEAILIAKRYDDVYLSLGFHPSEASLVSNYHLDALERDLDNEKVVAIGEIGLDYHYGKENIVEQKYLFEQQLLLAKKLHLPVIIHSRDATKDTIDILKNHHVKGIIHCFSGSLETAREYIAMGFLLGIGGVVTFKNSHLPQVLSSIDLSHIVLETDSPYLAPTPYRGEKNSSKYIPVIASTIAEIKQVSLEEVMEITTYNTTSLFDFS